ncbi:hypothetical protein ACJX0J_013599, partial [Zea mays]
SFNKVTTGVHTKPVLWGEKRACALWLTDPAAGWCQTGSGKEIIDQARNRTEYMPQAEVGSPGAPIQESSEGMLRYDTPRMFSSNAFIGQLNGLTVQHVPLFKYISK